MTPVKLFCLPFAGGSRYSYRVYELKAPPYLQVIPLEYPGRGARIKERFATDMDQLVDAVYNEMKGQLGEGSYALYGHSMGGIVAYYLARKLVANNHPAPMRVFITGTTAPAAKSVIEKRRHLMNKKEFIEEIRFLDGCPEEVLQSDELLDFVEPILRADFRVSETYSYSAAEPLDIPFTVITGTEEDLKLEDIQLWQLESTRPVDFRKMEGRHFFIFHHARTIIDLIARQIVNLSKVYQ